MIDSIFNLVFRCTHRRRTRPFGLSTLSGATARSYTVCLDCGAHFDYDMHNFRDGKRIAASACDRNMEARSLYTR
jgi:hypothetical protein